MDQITKSEWEKRIKRMEEIFGSMVLHADELSLTRCPYKNRFDECTAKFGCRNKRKAKVQGELPLCGGDENLNYRSAWDSDVPDIENV